MNHILKHNTTQQARKNNYIIGSAGISELGAIGNSFIQGSALLFKKYMRVFATVSYMDIE